MRGRNSHSNHHRETQNCTNFTSDFVNNRDQEYLGYNSTDKPWSHQLTDPSFLNSDLILLLRLPLKLVQTHSKPQTQAASKWLDKYSLTFLVIYQ